MEWLGEVPVHWALGSLKHLAWIRNGRDYKDVESPGGEYPVIGSGGQFANAIQYLYDGESVLLGRKGTIDKPLYIHGRFWTVDTMFYTEVSSGASAKFLYYNALTIPFEYYSTSTALPSMTQGDLLNHPCAIPTFKEQIQIARFLDHETARIDALIEEQQRLIELLKEKRQSVISHTVTKGLNSTVPMKDSGVEWLGEVPAHWDVKALRYLGECQNGINIGGEAFGSGSPFVSYGDVYKNDVLPAEVTGLVQSSPEDQQRYSIEYGDVFFTRTSETVDEIGFSATCFQELPNAVFAGFLIRFRPIGKSLTPGFSKYYFRNQGLRIFFNKEMNLVTRASLSQDLLKLLPVTLPPVVEQIKISDFLDRVTVEFASLLKQGIKAIDLLKERRSALISAAVTGKIDVRGWQPPTPATSPELAPEAV
ncbi:restriction endonuclease subunit S [Pseudomonas sp. PH1b]|uniref:restriction endonuclease subunit S n=1 Tax=Pseudomonas sp. PH1b TaxID=1397282 RepID=UPI00068DE095